MGNKNIPTTKIFCLCIFCLLSESVLQSFTWLGKNTAVGFGGKEWKRNKSRTFGTKASKELTPPCTGSVMLGAKNGQGSGWGRDGERTSKVVEPIFLGWELDGEALLGWLGLGVKLDLSADSLRMGWDPSLRGQACRKFQSMDLLFPLLPTEKLKGDGGGEGISHGQSHFPWWPACACPKA